MVTRNDVARLAGTSPAVVSYVMNNGPKPVSAATRSRVLAAVEELGYRPNAVARSLRARRTWTIGVIASDSAGGKSPFFGEFTRSCEDVAWERGYSVLLGNSAEDPARAEGYVRSFLERQVDGLVLMRVRPSPQQVKEMEGGIPVVTIDHEAPPYFSRLAVDDEEGGRLAAAHLAGHGHTRLAFIGGPLDIAAVELRLAGWRGGLAEAGLDSSLVALGPLSMEGGYSAAVELLAERPTAVFATTDHQAIGAMRAAADLGLRVPGDLAIIGFDGARESAFTVPGLTTIRQPIDEMARFATETLIAGVEQGTHQPVTKIYPAELVVRGSCGCQERQTP
ncbi:LacI family DNA-binding transcriptional regulator [Nonomuraea sp. CA-143628]|uniref:LacI family DNA-binding transcriptional regulator n=1 Tax=Nonomuraea sp. CA-143628 TaxID=3239997 RepID=UPI003D8C458B